MKKVLLPFLFCCLSAPLLWADDTLPPIPQGFEGPPPNMGSEDLPTIPDLDKPQTEQAPVDLETIKAPTSALKAIDKAQPTATPTPVAKVPTAVPTLVPTAKPAIAIPSPTPVKDLVKPTVEKNTLLPTPLPTEQPVVVPVVKKSVPIATIPPAKPEIAPVVMGGGLTDYFPAFVGMKWNYEYLKAEATGAKKTRVVECTEAKQFPNGTIRVSFQVTEGASFTENYSLLNGSARRTASGGKALESDLAFKLPKAGAPSAWTAQGVDGLSKACGASFGKAQVYQKTYPDCVIVKEKTSAVTALSYYAKGLGLVAVEVYGPGMKLLQEKSYAIVGEPTKN